MKTWLVVLLLGVGIVAGRGELNLTPLKMVIESDGPPQPRYFFQDSDRRLGFRIDPKMAVSGSAEAAAFRFTDLDHATMRLGKSPAQASVPFDEKGIETYQSVARSLLSTDATDVQLVEQIPNAVSINGWKSVQFIYTYHLFTFSYRRTITFLNFRENEQLIFDVSATTDDFKKVYSRSYRVINSIFELPLVIESGPT